MKIFEYGQNSQKNLKDVINVEKKLTLTFSKIFDFFPIIMK
jgi:hypothetical protein